MATKYFANDEHQYNQRFSDIAGESCQILTPIQGYEKQPLVSLEEAVEPIVPFLPDVKRMALLAKNKCKKPPSNNLSIDESASIMLYSMDWEPQEECLYHVLTKTLRAKNRNELIPWFLYLKLILTALYRLPSTNRYVYRCIQGDMREDYPLDETIYWWGFSSCTATMEALSTKEFSRLSGKKTLFMIESFSGKDIREHSDFQDEAEVLLPPGRQFKVVSTLDQGNNYYIIRLSETKPEYPLLESDSHNVSRSILCQFKSLFIRMVAKMSILVQSLLNLL
jgi:hypothetical protein